MAGRREPTFHGVGQGGDDHHRAYQDHPVHAPAGPSGLTRFVSGFQAISTMIGVPIALASGYTLYRSNFAPDTTCVNLRTSIVSMLDKNVDPATRRALVKRDVEAFEANCGAVDPDAQAAFRALLTADKPTAQAAKAAPKAGAETPKAEIAKVAPPVARQPVKEAAKEPAKDVAKEPVKTELRPAIVEKPAAEKAVADKVPAEKPVLEKTVAAAPATAESVAEEAEADAAMSDTRWLEAVRGALVEYPGEAREGHREAAKVEARETPKPQPVLSNKPGEPVLQPNWTVTAPAVEPVAQGVAAPLPPPVAVNDIQRTPADPNRPVPPASVPAAQYANNGSWIGQIPFVGRIIEGSGN